MTIVINHKQLSSLLKQYYKTKTPVYIWGTMGIGKSSIVKKVARELSDSMNCEFLDGDVNGEGSFGFIDIRISQLEPSDLRGLPHISKDTDNNEVTKWISPNWLPKNEKGKGILFFDELNQAPPSVLSACFQLILDRRLGDYKLPDGWIIISAGNTSSDRANIFELPAPLSNRFTHLELKVPSKDDWIDWALKNNINPNIISFMEFKPSYLYKFDRNNKDKAFATPRSWEFASRLLNDSEKLNNEDKSILISSAVGEGIGIEFMSFIKLQNSIDINSILDNPEQLKNIKEIDIKYSLLSAITEKYKSNKNNLEKCVTLCNYLEPEFAILLIKFMKNARKEFVSDVVKLKIWIELANKYSKYLL